VSVSHFFFIVCVEGSHQYGTKGSTTVESDVSVPGAKQVMETIHDLVRDFFSCDDCR
jgi:hypothetical protein